MRFADIHIENFLSIATAEVTLGGRGLVLVEGVNEDDPSAKSNGAGKSSFADALCWVLYGCTARGVTGDAVVNREAGKGTLVDLEIQDGTALYKIVRYRKHKTGKNGLRVWLYEDEKDPVDLTKGTDKLTQEVVNGIVGCSYEVFRAAVYAGQEQMPDLPGMTDKALKVLIEEAAGVTLLERAYERAKIACNEAKAVLERAQRNVDALASQHLAVVGEYERTTLSLAEWAAARKRRVEEAVAEAVAERANARTAEAELAKHDRPHVERQIAAEEAKIAGVEDEKRRLAELEAEIVEITDDAAFRKSEANTFKSSAETLKDEIEGLDHKVGAMSSAV